jgi:hypothetical protein
MVNSTLELLVTHLYKAPSTVHGSAENEVPVKEEPVLVPEGAAEAAHCSWDSDALC